MLRIVVPATELWDEKNEEFISVKRHVLQLEHSLVSISKWESEWEKPFLSKQDKTNKELLSYIKDMTITQNVPDEVFLCLTNDNYKSITDYIESSRTAKVFRNNKKAFNTENITSENIYYWMIAFNIPSEYQKWYLNRLLTLIRLCNEKNTTPKKRSRQEILEENARINAERKKKYHTNG